MNRRDMFHVKLSGQRQNNNNVKTKNYEQQDFDGAP